MSSSAAANQGANHKCNKRGERTRQRKPRYSGHSERDENDVSGHVCGEHMSEGEVTYRINQSRDSSGDVKQ